MSIVFGSPEAQAVLKRDRAVAGEAKVAQVNYDYMPPEKRDALPAYLVTCPTCGGMMGACTADIAHAKETATFIAGQILYGLVVNRVTVADVRNAAWCSCEKAVGA